MPVVPSDQLDASEVIQGVDNKTPGGDQNAAELFVIPTPEWNGPEMYLPEGSQWAVMRGSSFGEPTDGLVERTLLYKIPGDVWKVYDPVDFGREGVSHDPWGQAAIDIVLTLGLSSLVRASAAAVEAGPGLVFMFTGAGGGTIASSLGKSGLYRVDRVANGVKLVPARALVQAGTFVSRHPSGLVMYIRTGPTGQIERVRAALSAAFLRGGSAPSRTSRTGIGSGGASDAGHVIARLLGGSGSGRAGNLFLQNPAINRGPFRMWEKQIATWISEGRSVSVDIAILPGMNKAGRPLGIFYDAIVDGNVVPKFFAN